MSRIPRAVVEAVYERAAGECECCGAPLVGHVVALHHRKALKHKGPNTVENLMLVIADHHNMHQDSIHQNPARSRDFGHIVPSYVINDDIAGVPIRRRVRVARLGAL